VLKTMQTNSPDPERDPVEPPPSGEIIVRPSTDADAPAMLAIYTRHVQQGQNGMEFEPLQADDIKRRRKNMQKHRLPHIVADLNGVVVGYAYAVPFRKRPAYRYCVKNSIYVHQDHLRAGVGRKLLPALIAACAEAGYRQMIAYVDSTNGGSLNLHESCGFRRVACLEGIGFKFGRWYDSVMLQRALGPGASEPPPGFAAVSRLGIGDVSVESD
jgi:phosphinothricin acetyltransferase